MFKGEIVTSAIIFVGSLYLFWETFKFEGHEVYGRLGPSYWPKSLLLCLMGLSILVALDAIRQRKKGQEQKTAVLRFDPGKVRFSFAICFIVLYFILMQRLGFIAITPLFLAAFMLLLGERSKIWIISISIGITFLIVWVFTKAMYVPLPRGHGIFLEFSQFFY